MDTRLTYSNKQKKATWELRLEAVFLFVTFAFPKAGAIISGVPITLSTILYSAVLLTMLPRIIQYIKTHVAVSVYYAIYVIFICLNSVLAFGSLPLKQYLFPLVVAFSPLAFLIGLQLDYKQCMKILCVSGIVLGLYSVAQWLFGITQTTIPGITLALGDAWKNKPIGYGFIDTHEATKMPSTMQNGNNVALLCVLGIGSLLTWFPEKAKWEKAKWISIGMFIVALVLSGARSSVYPFIMLLPLGVYGIWKQYRHRPRKEWLAFAVTIFAAAAVVAVLLQIPQLTPLANKDGVYPSGNDPSRLLMTVGDASGRTGMWINMWETIKGYSFSSLIRTVFIGSPAKDMMMGGEGLPLFISMYGVISTILFIGLFFPLLTLVRKAPTFMWGALAFLGALAIDSSYNFPPILIWFFLLLGMFLQRIQGTVPAEGMRQHGKM